MRLFTVYVLCASRFYTMNAPRNMHGSHIIQSHKVSMTIMGEKDEEGRRFIVVQI